MMKKTKAWLLLGSLMAALLVTGCSSTEETSGGKETNVSKEQNKDSGETAKENTDKEEVKKEKADIEALAAEASFNVNWFTQDGEYAAGTSFLMDSQVHGEKLLVTAFHFLWPEDAENFSGSQLPEFVQGGELFTLSDYETVQATLKNCVVIEDADVVPNISKDVAAFTIHGGENLKTLPLAETAEAGETIYLLAGLWDTDDVHENNVYEGDVIGIEDGVLYYNLDGNPGTTGASGGPIVNEYGEVVAIHMGSGGGMYVGHAAESFCKQIDKGVIADIVYPETMQGESADAGAESEIEYIFFEREDKVAGIFYDVQVDSVTVTDSIQDIVCEDGYQFVIMDVSLKAADDMEEPFAMYYYDFCLEWEEEYCYPLETGLSDTQLPDEYTLTEEGMTGQLIFMAPLEKEAVYFTFVYDIVNITEEGEMEGSYSAVEIPLENWTR